MENNKDFKYRIIRYDIATYSFNIESYHQTFEEAQEHIKFLSKTMSKNLLFSIQEYKESPVKSKQDRDLFLQMIRNM